MEVNNSETMMDRKAKRQLKRHVAKQMATMMKRGRKQQDKIQVDGPAQRITIGLIESSRAQ